MNEINEFDAKLVGRNIRNLRNSRGLKQIELAEKIKINSNTLARWERGEIIPKIDTFWRLANYFQIKMDTIINYQSCPY